MIARMTMLTVPGLLTFGLAVAPAAGGDYGISFHYSSYAPSRCVTPYYGAYYPRGYAHYGDYCDPVVYRSYTTPRVIVYDDCYPPVYRTTYTRSDCYARPVRHAGVSVRYRSSAPRVRYYSKYPTYRRTYRTAPSYRYYSSSSRCSPRIHTRVSSGSRCRDVRRSSSRRYYRTPRVRIHRR